jgi:hypothetical protein
MKRLLSALVICASLLVGTIGPTSTQVIAPIDQPPPAVITVNGTVLRIVDAESLQAARDEIRGRLGPLDEMQVGRPGATQYAAFLTSDITGHPTLIWLDLSWLHDHNLEGYANLEEDEAIQVRLTAQPEGSFLAREYAELAKGSMVNNTDWGVEEAYTTRDDSINARVDNAPDDDEALNQGNKFDQSGKRQDDDDD